MSATVLFYTDSGFVVAADGRSASISGDNVLIETDEAQKIFQITSDQYTLAYVVSGELIASADRSVFDISAECRDTATRLVKRHPNIVPEFLNALGRSLKRYMGQAVKEGRIELPPLKEKRSTYRQLLTGIQFAGYAGSRPIVAELNLQNSKGGITLDQIKDPPEEPLPGTAFGFGSKLIPIAVKNGTNRALSKYRPAFEVNPSTATLADAERYARAYIEACSDPSAVDVDPKCRGIGGHLHICTVTPEHGFQWVVPPKDFAR